MCEQQITDQRVADSAARYSQRPFKYLPLLATPMILDRGPNHFVVVAKNSHND